MTEHEGPVCRHFQQAAELLAKRWTPQLIRALLDGTARFSDLRAAIPQISDHVLSARLKELEASGIVVRSVTPNIPVRIEYCLTERGQDLGGVIAELGVWAERWATV
jgi:DNA-binding HxlR family transcriptional regulator